MDGYWAYELCIGAHAWQHHTAAPGEPHPGPRHHIGEYRGVGAGRAGGADGRSLRETPPISDPKVNFSYFEKL